MHVYCTYLYQCHFWVQHIYQRTFTFHEVNDVFAHGAPAEPTLFENYSECFIWILAFSTNFCPIKTDFSGNTVWPQASVFQKLAKLTIIIWMRLFLWFSNTVRTTHNRCLRIQYNCCLRLQYHSEKSKTW